MRVRTWDTVLTVYRKSDNLTYSRGAFYISNAEDMAGIDDPA